MPYGVRAMMNGRSCTLPLAFFGVKIVVCSRTPSRIGIMTSLESNAGGAGAPAGVCARAIRGARAKNATSASRSSALRFMRSFLPDLSFQEIIHPVERVEPPLVDEGLVRVVGHHDQFVLDLVRSQQIDET